ncbi:MAG: hypothetical protein Q4C63_01980 [Eubacteriales bacterium]|nr:hypothetical protein [Eubacteriales bacterium]
MVKRRRRPKKSSFVGDIFHFVLAVALIVAAVFVVLYVAGKVKNIAGAFGKGETEASSSGQNIEINNETESASQASGFETLEDGSVKWRKDDGSFAKDEWIADGDELYYFNTNEKLQTGTKGIEGMLYTFSEDGRLSSIRYNPAYSPDQSSVPGDYPSLIQTRRLWAFLDEDDTRGAFSALMYKRTTDAMSYQLGGDENPQYTGPYSMQIDGNYIYFLPLTDGQDLTDEEASINGKLYRMKPGDTVRQIVAENVEGYKVLDGTVYYYADGAMHTTREAEDDTSKNKPVQSGADEVFYVIIEGGAAHLVDENGDAVSSDSGELKGRGFTYYLREDGTIRGVKNKTSVTTGGYTYYAETDTAFGETISRIMRKDGSGNEQIISAEFSGKIGNIHYEYETGNMIAEYTSADGTGRFVQITKAGDVDVLNDSSAGAAQLSLIGVQDHQAIGMRTVSGKDEFVTLSISHTTPLAVGVDPIDVEPKEENTEDPLISDAPAEQKTEAPGETGGQQKTEAAEKPETKAPAVPQETAAPQPAETIAPAEGGGSAVLAGPEGAVVGGAPQ